MTSPRNILESAKPDNINLLHRRMVGLGLDVDAWLDMEPAILRDLQRACSACGSRSKCVDVVAHLEDPIRYDGMDHCPDAAGLRTLLALQGFLNKNLTMEQAIERLGDHPQMAPFETD
jgi:hypothetical protein